MLATLPFLGYIVEGLTVTVGATLVGFAGALLIGATLSTLIVGSNTLPRYVASGYVTVFRALPELLFVFIVYYGLDIAMRALAARIGMAPLEISPFAAVTIALAMQFAAYCAEIFRDARTAIPGGLIEAGEAIGLSGRKVRTRIVLPLMFINATPALGNIFLVILKVSALASVIGLEEVTRRAKVVAGTTKEPFGAFAVAAICFLIVTALATALQHYVERRTNFGRSVA
ncbi:amino acid ABC transporter permease [Sinorhizobium psoraleae]|uniref:ABC transporter permease subunit n=1 Tax=Sinorhizobium psoraleae TaxID=520838 RepID=A0ABT4KAE0_9HYPH|nr:ABC transporter permease subunit [Sinorhizobium psoraleae]MCZ4088813.1 ABC transporter permease subunit [Sinorhizobium psoraleae]